ncbi:uncharacterized protein BDZ99DRAFT_113445 [Mytilinidion resinicola]|uniref:DUF7730 domain-containing protein n=1 Tax=Mytilinidion resinicola TaxID=574789 RepID=A0A6A6Y8G1_9PEZI|nr:uncharacterized protein BDZ99DRAFT_113445 [Mytilinidion resinicola]KAF2805126.1 hypothetical protein BDZ99DRAFT_113445 [Mytilinidion resinicola]
MESILGVAPPTLQPQSPFLRLPAELRVEILQYALHSHDACSAKHKDGMPIVILRRGFYFDSARNELLDWFGLRPWEKLSSKISDLLCISRQVFLEMEEIIYRNAVFSYATLWLWKHTELLQWADSLRPRNLRRVRYVRRHYIIQTLPDSTAQKNLLSKCGEEIAQLEDAFPQLRQVDIYLDFVDFGIEGRWPRITPTIAVKLRDDIMAVKSRAKISASLPESMG